VGRSWSSTSLQQALELYFQCCSITTSTSGQAIIASTLATGGVCPLTDERVFSSEHVKHALAIMLSCGMYDYSGEWAYSIGIPAKSGVSGCTMLVVPGVGGFSIYSPALDSLGNSVRGIELAKQLVQHFTFHYYDQMNGIVSSTSRKINPLEGAKVDSSIGQFCSLCYCTMRGDLQGVASILNSGCVDINQADYDQRTALHIAASEGLLHVCKFLLASGADLDAVDSWGNRPVDDAVREGHHALADHLRAQAIKKSNRAAASTLLRSKTHPQPLLQSPA
jgi:glutaminase